MNDSDTLTDGSNDRSRSEQDWSLDTRDVVFRQVDSKPDGMLSMGEEQLAKSAVLCGLLFLTIAVTGLFLERMFPPQPRPDISDCTSIDDNTARLRCYDRVAAGSATEPAKGATPPLF